MKGPAHWHRRKIFLVPSPKMKVFFTGFFFPSLVSNFKRDLKYASTDISLSNS